jgi:hypothetical protein
MFSAEPLDSAISWQEVRVQNHCVTSSDMLSEREDHVRTMTRIATGPDQSL